MEFSRRPRENGVRARQSGKPGEPNLVFACRRERRGDVCDDQIELKLRAYDDLAPPGRGVTVARTEADGRGRVDRTEHLSPLDDLPPAA